MRLQNLHLLLLNSGETTKRSSSSSEPVEKASAKQKAKAKPQTPNGEKKALPVHHCRFIYRVVLCLFDEREGVGGRLKFVTLVPTWSFDGKSRGRDSGLSPSFEIMSE